MKFSLNVDFDTLEDLVTFYEKVRNDTPPLSGNFTIAKKPEVMEITPKPLPGSIEEPDGTISYVSMADPKPEEEFPSPELVKEVDELNNDLQKAKDAIPDKRVFNRDEVKAFCAKARTEKGVNIKQILLSLGVTGFSALPDEKLGALYDAVKLAGGY